MSLPEKIIINEIITLKIIDESVTERLAELWNHTILKKNMWDMFPYPYTVEDAKWFINHAQQWHESTEWEKNYWIFINNQYAWNLWRKVKEWWRKAHNYHLGYWLGEPYRGKGYMTTIVSFLTNRMFNNISDCHRIYALAFGWNKWSARVLEKSWFTHEATLREAILREWKRYDEWIYGKLKGE